MDMSSVVLGIMCRRRLLWLSLLALLVLVTSLWSVGYITALLTTQTQIKRSSLRDPLLTTSRVSVSVAVQIQPSPTPPSLTKQWSTQPPQQRTIYAITPTRRRSTQLLDLTSLCQTLTNVDNLVWIVVEMLSVKSPVVTDLLAGCKVNSVHLVRDSSTVVTVLRRGAREINVGLQWVRSHCGSGNCSGVVFFMEDESKYDLRLFEQMRLVEHVGVWPVAFAKKTRFEGPVCVNDSIAEWHKSSTDMLLSASSKPFCISSIGYAVCVQCLLDHPGAWYGFTPVGTKSSPGSEDSDFLTNFLNGTSDPRLECRGSDKEVFVWQVKSEINPALRKHKYRWTYRLRI